MSQPVHSAALALPAQVAGLRVAAAWLHAECARSVSVPACAGTTSLAPALPDEAVARLDLCLHEALANILDHSGLPAGAEVRLRLQLRERSATLTVSDGGQPYDLTRAAVPARPLTLAETEPGGLGVLMLRAQSDQLDYEHRDGCNHLHITVRWGGA
ncbi:ATP-binding protein [Duganella sp. P38]|uniref:ATP-binding protein n=1 Tax=Duganella sp. P38 TaxID=3423949 RepID=UPI003D7A37CD